MTTLAKLNAVVLCILIASMPLYAQSKEGSVYVGVVKIKLNHAEAFHAERLKASIRDGRFQSSRESQQRNSLEPLFVSSRNQLPQSLKQFFFVTAKDHKELQEKLAQYKSKHAVESAYISPEATPANQLPKGPKILYPVSFVQQQGYLAPAPEGISAEYAWSLSGGDGRGVTIADVEGDWNKVHRDLKLKGTKIHGLRAGMRSVWFAHGTAVCGIIQSKENHYGTTGIARKAKVSLYSIFRTTPENQVYESVSQTIFRAAEALKPGDIILVEVQYVGTGELDDYIPVEYYDDVFAAISFATSRGITVVETAANGGANLDSAIYGDRFNPDIRDSGAIMVGAGGVPTSAITDLPGYPDNDRKRLEFSSYGRRVDMQNWGTNVVTTGYGDLYNRDKRRLTYTRYFNGTSSAAAITAAACAIVQSYAKEVLGKPLTPLELRQLLKDTGSPQRGGNAENRHIGPRPDLKAAMEKIDTMIN